MPIYIWNAKKFQWSGILSQLKLLKLWLRQKMSNSSGTATETIWNINFVRSISFRFRSNQTFCTSFFLSVFMQLPTRKHLRKSLLKTLQLMGWHVSATRHLFITIWADLLPCLNLLMSPLVTASCSKGGVLCSGDGPRERLTASIMWQSDMRGRRFRAR